MTKKCKLKVSISSGGRELLAVCERKERHKTRASLTRLIFQGQHRL